MIAGAAQRRAGWHASSGAVVGALVITVLATLVVVRVSDHAPARGTSADAIATFAVQIERLSAEGGQIVADGIKPGITDIAEHALPDEVLVRMATGWVASMDEVRSEAAALHAPGELAAVAARYQRALLAYVRTAKALLDAATTSGDRRAQLVERAIFLGTQADRLFDDASDSLSELQRTAGGTR